VSAQVGHYPFGEQWYAPSGSTKWAFTTYERDGESGLDYARGRTYVPSLGRFASSDPVLGAASLPQTLNRFAYVLNDSINMVDPLGLCGGGVSHLDESVEVVSTYLPIGGDGGGGGGFDISYYLSLGYDLYLDGVLVETDSGSKSKAAGAGGRGS